METVTCNLCGKELNEEDLNTCLNCGALTCIEDYDVVSGLCSSCCDNGPYYQC